MTAKKTHEQFVAEVQERRGGNFTVVGVYVRNCEKVAVRCEVCLHEWSPRATHLLSGYGCPSCAAKAVSQANRNQSLHLVGTTNSDGVSALEIKWEWTIDRSLKAGGKEIARLRCRCPQCGNEEWWIRANDFQKPGNSTHCGCLKSSRETINTHLNNPRKASDPSMLYIVPVWYDQYTKIGITNNFTKRSKMHEVGYDGAYFVSRLYPRAWVYVAEQILLRETLQWTATVLPKEMVEKYWPGSSELREFPYEYDHDALRLRFLEIIKDIETDGDWYRVYQEGLK